MTIFERVKKFNLPVDEYALFGSSLLDVWGIRPAVDAVIINEVPFVRIEEVLACKKDYNRPKDLEDIKMIEKYIHSKNNGDLYKV